MNRRARIYLFLFIALAISSRTALAEELIVLSPHWEGARREFADGFSRRYRADTGKDVTIRWLDVGGTSEILRFIRGSFQSAPEGIGVDLLFGGGTDPYVELARDALLARVDLPRELLAGIPAELAGQPLYDPDGRWYGAALAAFGILESRPITERVHLPPVREWRDLADPQLFDWIANGDPRRSGSIHFVAEVILQAYGWDEGWRIISGIAANSGGFASGAMEVGKNIATGEVAYGPIIDSYAGEIVRQVGAERVRFILPRGLSVINADALAMLKGAPHPDTAARFIKFVLSEEGQLLWWGKKGAPGGPQRYSLGKLPVRPALIGAVPSDSIITENPFSWEQRFRYDSALGARRWRLVNDLFGVFVGEVHGPLREVGSQLAKGAAADAPLRIPVSELEAMKVLDERLIDDPARYAALLREWRARSWARFPPEATALPLGRLALLLLCATAIGWRAARIGRRARGAPPGNTAGAARSFRRPLEHSGGPEPL